jgi:hypothetical protein
MGVEGSGLPGVSGNIHRRGLGRAASLGSGENSGEDNPLVAESRDEDEEEEDELDEASELPVPLRTSCRRPPVMGDVKRDGEGKPGDTE